MASDGVFSSVMGYSFMIMLDSGGVKCLAIVSFSIALLVEIAVWLSECW